MEKSLKNKLPKLTQEKNRQFKLTYNKQKDCISNQKGNLKASKKDKNEMASLLNSTNH